MQTVPHNVICRTEVSLLFKSKSLRKEVPSGFLSRPVFTMGLLTEMRPTAICTLRVSQVHCTTLMARSCFVIQGAVGSASCASKTSRVRLKAVGQKPQESAVSDETYDWSINFFKDIDIYP